MELFASKSFFSGVKADSSRFSYFAINDEASHVRTFLISFSWEMLIKGWCRAMDRLIIVEGLPGSGKTTFAQLLQKKLLGITQDVHLYLEGDLHPVDLAWCAYLTIEAYQDLCIQYPEFVPAFERNKVNWQDHIVLAYTKIENLSSDLYASLESHEVYDNRIGKEAFFNLHQQRWAQFGGEATGTHIFECAFLQNHVNELLLFHCEDEAAILLHLQALIESVSRLKPVILYLDLDAKAAIQRAAEERIDEQGNRIWEQGITTYISQTPFGKQHGFTGVAGMHRYFSLRKKLELKMIEQLPIETHRVTFTLENQSEVLEKILNQFT